MEQLNKIAILRKLGLSIEDIHLVLENEDREYNAIIFKKNLELEQLKSKHILLQKIMQDKDWDTANTQLEILEQKKNISTRLLEAFPGYYGKYLSIHFGMYLNEPIQTEKQKEAYDTIVSFFDNFDVKVPVELQEYLDDVTSHLDVELLTNVSITMNETIKKPEKYIKENYKTLEQYMMFKHLKEYSKSLAYTYQEFFSTFNKESGYYDIFIPAMKSISKTYQCYCEKLQEANELFLKSYSDGEGKL